LATGAPQLLECLRVRAELPDRSQFVRRAARIFEKIDGVDDGCGHAFGACNGGEFGKLKPLEAVAHDGMKEAVRDEISVAL
jgi:hypothetical protein